MLGLVPLKKYLDRDPRTSGEPKGRVIQVNVRALFAGDRESARPGIIGHITNGHLENPRGFCVRLSYKFKELQKAR